jgi:prepilin-type N-terminal cleavage/methylation domain-containing protein
MKPMKVDALVGRKGAGREAGFTLIELMVALVVLSVGLFSIIHLQIVAVRGNAYARERYEASLLAQAVAEDLRTQVLVWMDMGGAAPDFAGTFPQFTIDPVPAQGTEITMNELHSVQNFNGQIIAAGDAPVLAQPINPDGLTQAGPASLDNARAIYRVHYTAHLVEVIPGQPVDGEVVRFTVFISWDNKDHGAQNQARLWDEDLAGWFNPATFFQRHMVTVTFYLARKKIW